MTLFIISIILTALLFGVLGIQFGENLVTETKRVVGWEINKKQIFALCGMSLCVFGLITTVPANTVGVIYSPFGGTKTETLAEGFHTKSIFDKVYEISTSNQEKKLEGLTTQTKDAQYLNSVLTIKYKVNENNAYMVFKQYKTLDNMSEQMIRDTTQRELEAITTKYNIIDILGEQRNTVYAELDAALKKSFAKYGVDFVSVTINDMDAGEALEKAIAEEAVAKKAVETAQQNLEKAEIEAQQLSVQALAEQEAAKIEAETLKIQAQAQKEANELLNQSLSDAVLEKQWIEKWNGKLPTYCGGNADLMIGIE